MAKKNVIKILNITSILPAPISKKSNENDVIYTSSISQEKLDDTIYHDFLFVVPYSNLILSFLSKKWKEYRLLRLKGSFQLGAKTVNVIGWPSSKYKFLNRFLLDKIGHILFYKKLRKLSKDGDYDIIHSHNVFSDFQIGKIMAKAKGIKLIITVRGIDRIGYNNTNRIAKADTLIALNKTQLTISQSFHTNVHLIPHGISKIFYEEPHSLNAFNAPAFVTISKLVRYKNIQTVISALSVIDIPFKYDIYGEGPELSNLKELVSQMNLEEYITFKGKIPYSEVPSTLSKYNFFILTSYPETFGRVYIEAMARKLPVIASIGTGVDGIIVDGREGFLVPYNNVELHSERILKLIENQELRNEMGSLARKKSLNFTWKDISRININLYKNEIRNKN